MPFIFLLTNTNLDDIFYTIITDFYVFKIMYLFKLKNVGSKTVISIFSTKLDPKVQKTLSDTGSRSTDGH